MALKNSSNIKNRKNIEYFVPLKKIFIFYKYKMINITKETLENNNMEVITD